MKKTFERLHENNVTGEKLASVLFTLLLVISWPLYTWTQRKWISLAGPFQAFWFISAIYFAFEVWLIMLVAREFDQYPGMSIDALLGGALLSVGALLRDEPLRSALAKNGFGAAPWIVFVCTGLLLTRCYAGASEKFSPK